ncbi:MAG: chorismate mutase, partial [Planctomycetota bacterium]
MPAPEDPPNASRDQTNAKLAPLREKIDTLDAQLVQLLNERAAVVVEVGHIKRDSGESVPIYAPDREQQVLAKIKANNAGPLPDRCLDAIWRELMSGSFALERPLRIGYLGPAGSFSHLAARKKFGASVEYDPLSDFSAIFDAVARGHADYGLIPIENSTHGGVTASLDCFL